jgi:hypothetical protein
MAGGEYRSIKKGDSQSMVGVRWHYIGHRPIKMLLPRSGRAQDLVSIESHPVKLSGWLDNRERLMIRTRNHDLRPPV